MGRVRNTPRAAQWTDDCAWPRRLLHVESMTSYPWQPRNTYGGYKAPRYNAITYTWGRFSLRPDDAEYASTEPLPIRGISWPVPRVKASHFTADQFRRVIESVAFPPDDDEDEPAEFVWLDVACIDQTYPRTEEYYSEVGRQARIFRGAQEVAVWLTAFDAQRLGKWWTSLKAIEEPVIGVEVGNPPDVDLTEWIGQVRGHLREMRADPWFSSLWTLQEAFLRPNASILCKDGRYQDQFGRVGSTRVRSGQLRDLIFRWNDVIRRLQRLKGVEKLWGFRLDQGDVDALVADIGSTGFLEADNIGFQAFRLMEGSADFGNPYTFISNPLMLLAASHKRECWEQTDRVRGIMQVFDLQLGESAPSAIPGKTYSLSELEDELGAALLRKYPISSHLMTQERSCPTRKAWRVSRGMTPLENAHALWRQIADQGDPAIVERKLVWSSNGARLSPREFESTWTVKFEGRYTPVETFVGMLDKLLSPRSIFLHLDGKWAEELQGAHLGTPYSMAKEFEWLMNRFQGRNLGILYLAQVRPPPKGKGLGDVYCDWVIGLLLCQEQGRADVYERLGVLIWDVYVIGDLMKLHGFQLQETDMVVDGWDYLVNCKSAKGWHELCGHYG